MGGNFWGHHTTQDGNVYGLGALLVSQVSVPRVGVDAVLDVHTFHDRTVGALHQRRHVKAVAIKLQPI